ncbi:hypothetical protein [Thalassococcus sp. S3]|uniref:COG3904 family protein n=1 Tax=Thalassococcus sp. S3 TaxID=2017482 RepID=UPI0010246439|nr:hypothetical protein [Thalassococcus sp. S3]QBF32450.1 hypothetical protein CFI11_14680 [Thalassococcus sp. S3]
MTGPVVGRVLRGVLIFQLFIGAFLVLGDVQGGLRMPSFGPSAPALTEPVRPGDQRRDFNPGRTGPGPSGPLPDRLTLTAVDGGVYRLEGAIDAGDAARIISQLEQATPAVETLLLQSPGGSVTDALDLGRHVREAGINTALRGQDVCYSACPYLLAAGVEREIDETASVGVHQHYFGESSLLPAFVAVEDIQRGQGEVMVYLDAMGIDPLVMQHALTTPPDEIYVLLPEQLQDYGFVTADQ